MSEQHAERQSMSIEEATRFQYSVGDEKDTIEGLL